MKKLMVSAAKAAKVTGVCPSSGKRDAAKDDTLIQGEWVKVPVLYRHPQTGFFEPALCDYEGPVPVKVWSRLNKQFLKLQAGNYFFPLDSEEAYQDAVAYVAEKARLIRDGKLVLRKATPETYLTSTAKLAFLNFHKRKVQPVREIYRSVERRTMGCGAVGEDGFDIDNYDGTQDNPDKIMCDISEEPCHGTIPVGTAMTAQQLVETLPGIPYRREREEKATALLGEICEGLLASKDRKLGEEIVNVFAAYIVADGNHFEAAHLVHIGKNRWYRCW